MHQKEVLEEFIYKLHEKCGFCGEGDIENFVETEFSYNHTMSDEFMEALLEEPFFSELRDGVICCLNERLRLPNGYSASDSALVHMALVLCDPDKCRLPDGTGIVFTKDGMYVNTPQNSDQQFSVQYQDIQELSYRPDEHLLVIKASRGKYVLNTIVWNIRLIYDFLQFALERYDFDEQDKSLISSINLDRLKGESVGVIAAGVTYGNVSNASSIYFDDKLLTPRGHGFAAEHANHLMDRFMGKKAKIVGDDNAKNGPDRMVNGVAIQSKYCASGSKCIQECFENGQFRYWNRNGTPMQIEVPSDMYDAAVQAMENRIRRGEMGPNITDPEQAKNIIRKGHFTYAQAKNIAKAGTVESIVYDAASGAIIARNTFGITAVLTFATDVWNGESVDVALKHSAIQGIKVGGVTFATAVLSGQLSKMGLNSLLVGSSETIVHMMGPKASAALVNAFRSGSNIYGAAAMKSAAKLLRSNTITAAVSFAVLSAGDVSNIFRGRISGGQLFKNLTNTAASIAGGTAGWVGGTTVGAAIGTFIMPGIGTAIGGKVGAVLGGLGGGKFASTVAGAVLDEFIEDDADQMVEIIQEVFTTLAGEYLVTQQEAEKIVESLQAKLTGGMLKDMYASGDREIYARNLLESDFQDIASKRQYIKLPSNKQMRKAMKAALKEDSSGGKERKQIDWSFVSKLRLGEKFRTVAAIALGIGAQYLLREQVAALRLIAFAAVSLMIIDPLPEGIFPELIRKLCQVVFAGGSAWLLWTLCNDYHAVVQRLILSRCLLLFAGVWLISKLTKPDREEGNIFRRVPWQLLRMVCFGLGAICFLRGLQEIGLAFSSAVIVMELLFVYVAYRTAFYFDR